MSIKLALEEYCYECPNFKPKVIDDCPWPCENREQAFSRSVVCESRNLCRQIERYLNKQINKSEIHKEIEKERMGD